VAGVNVFAELYDHIAIGAAVAVSPTNLMYCLLGVFLGQLLGTLPGIGTLVAITLLFPITYHLEPTTALIMLAGIYYGAQYGGSTASILLNLPGTPSSAVACLDGYPLARQGRAGVALFMTTLGSFVGGSIGIVLMMMFSPTIAEAALRFGPWEYVSIILMGLASGSTVGSDSPLKGIATVIVGIVIGLVGQDIGSGLPRFTFGSNELLDGVGLVAIAIGLFGIAEVISTLRPGFSEAFSQIAVTLRSMIPTRDDLRRSWMPMFRGTWIGSFFGVLPGTGPMLASFVAYAVERKVADDPSRFGKGAMEGLVAPETANNAAGQTEFIPTMTLGIPGSATMAIMLGVLIMNGITPGPSVITDQPELFWGLIMSFWIGNIVLVILNIPMISIWTRVLTVPYRMLYPLVLAFVCMGIYSIAQSGFDIWVVFFAGAIGYFFRMLDLPLAPCILGVVLGPMLEEHFRRSLVLSHGSFSTFIERPVSLVLLIITALIIASPLYSRYFSRKVRPVESGESPSGS
jgi:TctA family transporter